MLCLTNSYLRPYLQDSYVYNMMEIADKTMSSKFNHVPCAIVVAVARLS